MNEPLPCVPGFPLRPEAEGLIIIQVIHPHRQSLECRPNHRQSHHAGVMHLEIFPIDQPMKQILKMGEMRQGDDQPSTRCQEVQMFLNNATRIFKVFDKPD